MSAELAINNVIMTRTVRAFSVERMTVDLFDYHLTRDWPDITEGLEILKEVETREFGSPYLRQKTVSWARLWDNFGATIITWEQAHTDCIHVEIFHGGALTDRIVAWAKMRFRTSEASEQEAALTPKPTDDNLTKTEKIVAGYFAGGLKYDEIALQMGKNANTILSHAQHIARKWGIRRVPEALQLEAQRRGYSHLKR